LGCKCGEVNEGRMCAGGSRWGSVCNERILYSDIFSSRDGELLPIPLFGNALLVAYASRGLLISCFTHADQNLTCVYLTGSFCRKVLHSRTIHGNKSSAVAEMGDRLATIDMDRNLGSCCAVPHFVGELGPHLTQCCLGRGLPPYQVVS